MIVLLLNLCACSNATETNETDGQACNFPDPHLEAAIREAIDKPEDSIYASDLEGLTSLISIESGIADYLHSIVVVGGMVQTA